eukprot:6743199-Lingulodinium_polyedra.AAC.1
MNKAMGNLWMFILSDSAAALKFKAAIKEDEQCEKVSESVNMFLGTIGQALWDSFDSRVVQLAYQLHAYMSSQGAHANQEILTHAPRLKPALDLWKNVDELESFLKLRPHYTQSLVRTLVDWLAEEGAMSHGLKAYFEAGLKFFTLCSEEVASIDAACSEKEQWQSAWQTIFSKAQGLLGSSFEPRTEE